MKLTKELENLGCILIEKKPKFPTYFSAKIIHFSQIFFITQRIGAISQYFVDGKGLDTSLQVCKYIKKTINNNLKENNK